MRTLEALHLRPEFAAFEDGLAAQIAALDTFRHRSFTRVRGLSGRPGRLVMLSDHVAGMRLSDILRMAADRHAILDADSALYLTKRLFTAMGAYVTATGYSHGALAPERIIADASSWPSIPWGRFWSAAGTPRPAGGRSSGSRGRSREPIRCSNERTDVAQIALIGLALLHGRLLGAGDGPGSFEALLASARLRTALGNTRPLPGSLYGWFEQALSTGSRPGFGSVAAAGQAFEQFLTEDFQAGATRTSLTRFLGRAGEPEDRTEDFSVREIGVAPPAPARHQNGPDTSSFPGASRTEDPVPAADEQATSIEPIATPIHVQPTPPVPPPATRQFKTLDPAPGPGVSAADPRPSAVNPSTRAEPRARPRRWARSPHCSPCASPSWAPVSRDSGNESATGSERPSPPPRPGWTSSRQRPQDNYTSSRHPLAHTSQ